MDRVTKKKLTTVEAAEQWKTAKRDMADAKALLEEAEPVLLEHFEKKNLTSYRGIGLVLGSARTVLDQAKVREYLGAQLKKFQKTTEPKKSLQLLG